MPILYISQYDAALRQTNAAIRMYLNEEDGVATHTVACAALGIFDKLLKQGGTQSTLEELKSYVRPDKQKYVVDKVHEAQNFFKHGDDNKPSVEFNPESTEMDIFLCCVANERLGAEPSKEMRVFQFGMSVNNPNLLVDNDYKTGIMSLRANVPAGQRAMSKLQLLEILRNYQVYKKP